MAAAFHTVRTQASLLTPHNGRHCSSLRHSMPLEGSQNAAARACGPGVATAGMLSARANSAAWQNGSHSVGVVKLVSRYGHNIQIIVYPAWRATCLEFMTVRGKRWKGCGQSHSSWCNGEQQLSVRC